MKIIEKADPGAWKCEVSCSTCKSKLEAGVDDFTLNPGTNDGPRVGSATFSFSCPVCKSYNSVAEATVPNHLHYAVKRATTSGGGFWGDH